MALSRRQRSMQRAERVVRIKAPDEAEAMTDMVTIGSMFVLLPLLILLLLIGCSVL